MFWHENQVRFRASYPLGVVRLCEDHSGISAQKDYIACVIRRLFADFDRYEVKNQVLMQECSLIGTAGTVTTLAAADLKLLQYDWKLVNNHILAHQTLVITSYSIHYTKLYDEGGMVHTGEEFALVVEGALEFVIDGDRYVLNEGDSLVFKASLPHRWRNIHQGQTLVLWVVSPAPHVGQ